jgi:hypothetical protein
LVKNKGAKNMFNPKVVGILFIAVSAFGQTTTPIAPPTFTSSSNLPPIGLAITETAQVNLVNTAKASSSGTAASCGGSVAFYNSKGTIIGTATSFTVGSGQIFSVTLPYASAGASGSRTVVRAVITSAETIAIAITGSPGVAIPPCSLAYSLETYDTATGVTHAYISGVGEQGLIGVGLSTLSPVLSR